MRPSRLPAFVAVLLVAAAGRLSAQPAAAPAAREAPLGAAERVRYVGHFTLADSAGGGTTPLRVFEEGGVLLGQLRTNEPTRLVHAGGHTFRPAAAPEFRLVFTLERGRAARVAMLGPGVELRGSRDAPGAPAPADSSRAGALYDTLARMDSLLFDASYVACDTARVFAMLADDVEFYHDLTGVHRGAEVRADFARLAAGCPRVRGVRREVVPGSLRVYPIAGFGAVQTGEHRFVEGSGGSVVAARFVHVWRRDGSGWRANRILSLDHHATSAR